jgi:putative flippase GtrA
VANYGVAAFLFSRGWAELVAVIIGAFVGTFWNYTMNRLITWGE